jgi:hypothetical protein
MFLKMRSEQMDVLALDQRRRFEDRMVDRVVGLPLATALPEERRADVRDGIAAAQRWGIVKLTDIEALLVLWFERRDALLALAETPSMSRLLADRGLPGGAKLDLLQLELQ